MPLDRRQPTLGQLATACCELVRRGRKSRREGAEDIAQDACVHVLRLAEPRTVQEPARYLARIVRNLSIDRTRRCKREAVLFDPAADAYLAAAGIDPERITSGEQILARALATIEGLPPRCREAFELHRFEGLSYIGIAHRMGISISMVEKHIAEAMLRLAEGLARDLGEGLARPRRLRRRG